MDIKNLSPEINKLLSDFENQNDSVSHEELDLAVEILIFEIALIRYNLTEATESERMYFKEWLKTQMRELDTNNPSRAHSEKVIRRIGQGKHGEGAGYIESLLELADSEFKDKQKKIAQKDRRNNPLFDLLVPIIKNDPTMRSEDVYLKLLSEAKNQRLLMPADDEDTLEFSNEWQKPVKIKTVKNWISELKKKFSR